MKDQISLNLSPAPGLASASRSLLTDELPAWGLGDLVDDAVVVLSELVTNAVAHVGEPFSLDIRAEGNGLRIEVSDPSPTPPLLRDPLADLDSPNPEDVGGRGLLLVATLAAAWGWTPHEDGKTVWARLILPPLYEAEFERPAYGAVVRRYATFRSAAKGMDGLETSARVRLSELPRVGDVDGWTLVGVRRVDDGQDAGEHAGGDR